MKKLFSYIAKRLGEPTTWAGIAMMLGAFKMGLSEDQINAITLVGLALFGGSGAVYSVLPDAILKKSLKRKKHENARHQL